MSEHLCLVNEQTIKPMFNGILNFGINQTDEPQVAEESRFNGKCDNLPSR